MTAATTHDRSCALNFGGNKCTCTAADFIAPAPPPVETRKPRGGDAARSLFVKITPDDLDGGYVAEVVGLPGCASQGETVGDALRNIAEAYEGVRDTLAELGRELSL